MQAQFPKIVLGSTSPFRASLMEKLHIPFGTAAPNIDETPKPTETPESLVARLTREKAQAVAERFSEHLIITSDQIALHKGEPLGKPGNHANAMVQLKQFSGETVTFLTGLGLLNTATGHYQSSVEPFHVHFRALTEQQIDAYLNLEQPYHCAGSFKSEGLGITLFNKLEGDDPNTLIGLPLIRLTEFLGNEGLHLPAL